MNNYLAKKTSGFYLTAAAALFTIVGMIFFKSVEGSSSAVFMLLGASLALEVIMVVVTAIAGNKKILELISAICAVLMAGAFIQSLIPQVDNFGYLVSGLYSFNDMKSYILYAAFAVLALICYTAASFMDQSK